MNKKPTKLPLNLQLTLAMAIAVSIGLLFVGLYLKIVVASNVQSEIVKAAVLQAEVVGERSIAAINNMDDETANNIVSQFSTEKSVDSAAIFLPDKSLLGLYSKIKGIPLPSVDVANELVRTENSLKISEPILFGKKLVGYVYVEHSTDKLIDSKDSFSTIIILIGLVTIVICFFLANFFEGFVTRPIKKMVEHINHFYKSKDFKKRIVLNASGELGKLEQGFNRMLDMTQKREQELLGKGKQLQKLVDVRTKQLFQKVHYDALTGLPNRYLLVDRLHQAISKSTRSKSIIAILFLDLDRFKVINDTFGHQNGDLLLKEVTKRLKRTARDGDTVARLGGDEFVFLLESLANAKDAARTALRIIECFSQPFQLQDHILHMSTSIGISIYPDDGLGHEILLKNADISMYDAKKKGPGNFSFYSDEMNNASLERLAVEANLRKAIENNELKLVYQPQRNLKNSNYKNAEALIRWTNPELGFVSPGVFIPIAEETGLIKQIDLWVISQVCKQIKHWNEQGLTDLTIAINVSAAHLISANLLEHLKTEIIVNQIKAEQVEIEITEEVFVEQREQTVENLKAIKKLGAKIAIDDFGTGYSSLQYIQDFPADTLKLDGMFIQNLETDEASQGIVRSTIILAHSLGLELVAECVENQAQADFLHEYNCDLIQGYFYSKPIPPEDIPNICS